MNKHKHKGMLDSRGYERLHDIKIVHRNNRVQRWHNASLPKKQAVKKPTVTVPAGKHKHGGVVRSDTGAQRLHPIKQQHKNSKTQRLHNLEIGRRTRFKGREKVTVKPTLKVAVDLDSNKYVVLDLTKLDINGVKVKFERREGNKRRTVGLIIDK